MISFFFTFLGQFLHLKLIFNTNIQYDKFGRFSKLNLKELFVENSIVDNQMADDGLYMSCLAVCRNSYFFLEENTFIHCVHFVKTDFHMVKAPRVGMLSWSNSRNGMILTIG